MNKFLFFCCLLGGIFLSAVPAHAIPCPWDEKGSPSDDCATSQTDYFNLVYASRTAQVVAPLAKVIDTHLRGFGKRMGAMKEVTATPKIKVIVAPNSEAFARSQLSPNAPVEWAAGIAYSAQHLIILSLEPEHYFKLHDIARHEISHIALYRATGIHMPRWFNEGLAILHAEEYLMERIQLADKAFLAGGLTPFSELVRFPRKAGSIPLAYAQSARFVRYLEREHHLGPRLPALVREIREGQPFDTAFQNAMGISVAEAEAGWLAEMEENTSWFSFFVNPEWLWVLAAFVFLLAYIVKRRRTRQRLADWKDNEGEVEDESWPPHPLPPSSSVPSQPPDSTSEPPYEH